MPHDYWADFDSECPAGGKVFGRVSGDGLQTHCPECPISCSRIGSRVVFDESDIRDYKANCRAEHVPMPPLRLCINEARNQRPPGALSLEESFKRMGIKMSIWKKRG